MLSRPKAGEPERSPRRDEGREAGRDDGHDGDTLRLVRWTGRGRESPPPAPTRRECSRSAFATTPRNARAAPGKRSVARAGVEGFPSGVPRDQPGPQGARPEDPPGRASTPRQKGTARGARKIANSTQQRTSLPKPDTTAAPRPIMRRVGERAREVRFVTLSAPSGGPSTTPTSATPPRRRPMGTLFGARADETHGSVVSGGHEVSCFWRAGSHLFLGRSSSLIAQRRVFFLAWFFFPPDSSARAAAAQMC